MKIQSIPEEAQPVRAVVGYARPYDQWDEPYQAYYRHRLEVCMKERGGARLELLGLSAMAPLIRLLRTVRGYSIPVLRRVGGVAYAPAIGKVIDALAHSLAPQVVGPATMFVPIVGQYLVTFTDGGVRRVCIDAADNHFVNSAALRDWADVYYKSNMWASEEYPSNVKPVVNGNPGVSRDEDRLRAMRGQTPEYDLSCIVRVWAGSSAEEGTEHCIRLLESLSQMRCRKYLCGVLVQGDIRAQARRLERCGVPWRAHVLPLSTLRQVAARSRLSVLRLGVHHCIPWRMVELLAMGCAIVLDRKPFSRWPEPLVAGEHFLDLALGVGPGCCVASDTDYEAIPARVEGWLASETLPPQLSTNAAQYFDHYAAPKRVGAYLLDSCVG